jgi:hypothetical protein
MPHTRLINVMDREADFFELFDEQRRTCSGFELLVRAKHDRLTTAEKKLFETLRDTPVKAQLEIAVPRQSARAKKSQQQARAARPARIAKVSLRYRQVTIKPTAPHTDKAPITLWVVHIRNARVIQNLDIRSCGAAISICRRCVKVSCSYTSDVFMGLFMGKGPG